MKFAFVFVVIALVALQLCQSAPPPDDDRKDVAVTTEVASADPLVAGVNSTAPEVAAPSVPEAPAKVAQPEPNIGST